MINILLSLLGGLSFDEDPLGDLGNPHRHSHRSGNNPHGGAGGGAGVVSMSRHSPPLFLSPPPSPPLFSNDPNMPSSSSKPNGFSKRYKDTHRFKYLLLICVLTYFRPSNPSPTDDDLRIGRRRRQVRDAAVSLLNPILLH